MEKGKYICGCKNPWSPAIKGHTTYIYENQNFRMFSGIQQNTRMEQSLQNQNHCERAIDHLKINMCVA